MATLYHVPTSRSLRVLWTLEEIGATVEVMSLGARPRLQEPEYLAINPAGTLHCAVGRSGLEELETRAEQWGRRGAPVTLLDAAETARRVGTDAYAGALLDRRAGTIQPLAYVRGLAKAAIAAGVQVHTASPVVGAERTGKRWTVRTERGSVSADWVVVATNAYTVAPWAEVRAELVHLPYFNFATKPLSPDLQKKILPGREGAWDTAEILSSFRFDKRGRLVFGSVGALRGTGAAIHKAWARRSLRKLFPEIGGVEFEVADRRDRLVAQEAGRQRLQPCVAIGIERRHPARAPAHAVPQGRFGWLGFGACEQASDQRTHARAVSGTCPAGSCASAAGGSRRCCRRRGAPRAGP